ncbi:unnamed protein product [Parascedosporium putredinis]|uniref:Serine-tRNA synthetase type1 N-terminal domain-containing protein n=1 Tax=Parascedosporium putredinis TaxID=1442378 RepID=A0A9P1GTY6_9PEZI|nr:unnamed protein product [Parascedosporium putredinis]CAI7987261.1 unnamed protein product [Parascedosporium putredinis]
MLDVVDFISERGGNPEKIRDSQRRRYADVEVVDQVIALWEDHRKTLYQATQVGSKINEVQKQIGIKKKAKEDASELLEQKVALDLEKKALIDAASEKEASLKAKVSSIGNIVHETVPVSNNEDDNEIQKHGLQKDLSLRRNSVFRTTKSSSVLTDMTRIEE